MMKPHVLPQVMGWIAVVSSTIAVCFWAYWGIIENFHEGWYHETLQANIGMLIFQYLSPMLILLTITLISIVRPRVGSLLHLVLALFVSWFFNLLTNSTAAFIVIPLIAFAGVYWYSNIPHPQKSLITVITLPMLTIIIAGAEPLVRVSQRVDDGNMDARLINGNGVSLIWAPAGIGWPSAGMSWEGAVQTCTYLNEDGQTRNADPQNIWRLPTVDEVVLSMTRHGKNASGVWHGERSEATYAIRPDKESPLWNTRSSVIYWWTATEIDADRAFIVAYDGRVWPRSKHLSPDSLGYRCVMDVSPQQNIGAAEYG